MPTDNRALQSTQVNDWVHLKLLRWFFSHRERNVKAVRNHCEIHVRDSLCGGN